MCSENSRKQIGKVKTGEDESSRVLSPPIKRRSIHDQLQCLASEIFPNDELPNLAVLKKHKPNAKLKDFDHFIFR